MSLDSFLNTLVSLAIQNIQVSDASIDGTADDDPVVRSMAKIAYAQICGFCNRYFEKTTYTEEYHSVFEKIHLRHSPVTSVSKVMVNGVLLVLDVDYSIIGNRLTLLKAYDGIALDDLWDLTSWDFQAVREKSVFTNVSLGRNKDVIVEYIGGFNKAEDSNDLFQGLMMQTMANYNRRSTLGMTSVSGRVAHVGATTVDGASDKGDVLESVQGIVTGFIDFSDVDYV